MIYKLIFHLIVGISVFGCIANSTSTANESLLASTADESLLGQWEGYSDGTLHAIVTFADGTVQIEYVVDPISTRSHTYRVGRENDRAVLYIENVTERLFPVIKGNTLRLELSESDNRKADVTKLATLTFRRPSNS